MCKSIPCQNPWTSWFGKESPGSWQGFCSAPYGNYGSQQGFHEKPSELYGTWQASI